ncbi:hypothetical protein KBI33_02090 [Candidatus Shapirobacteria bacterium]|nr:hypothetical protein [Candidatus Shapirobacteria bacterium]
MNTKTKVFFAASSDVSREKKQRYREIIYLLENQGFATSQVIFRKKDFDLPSGKIDYTHIYESVIEEINNSDLFIADISYPSGGVGYQVYHAFYQKKPIIVLFTENEKSNPSMIIRGIKSRKFFTLKYKNLEDLKKNLLPLIRKAKKQSKVRFQLVIDNKDYSFIETVANSLGISKTEYLKRLIRSAREKFLNER